MVPSVEIQEPSMVLSFTSGVGQNIALHVSPAGSNSTCLISISRFRAFNFIDSKSSPLFVCIECGFHLPVMTCGLLLLTVRWYLLYAFHDSLSWLCTRLRHFCCLLGDKFIHKAPLLLVTYAMHCSLRN